MDLKVSDHCLLFFRQPPQQQLSVTVWTTTPVPRIARFVTLSVFFLLVSGKPSKLHTQEEQKKPPVYSHPAGSTPKKSSTYLQQCVRKIHTRTTISMPNIDSRRRAEGHRFMLGHPNVFLCAQTLPAQILRLRIGTRLKYGSETSRIHILGDTVPSNKRARETRKGPLFRG